MTNEALYPFGHGLGYSTMHYADTQTSAPDVLAGGASIAVSATVTNVGRRQMHEVAQLYIHDKVASITQPVRALKGIRHIDLDPGQSVRVSFALTRADLAFVHPDRRTFAEPGAFDVWVAPSSVGGVPATVLLA